MYILESGRNENREFLEKNRGDFLVVLVTREKSGEDLSRN